MAEPLQSRAQHELRMDLQGRLRNTKVAAQDAFLPLFEAVVNSIHSTEERFGADVGARGRVDIHVHRVKQHVILESSGRPPIEPIESFTIVDNGMGFTDENLRSFETADSDAKLSRGGKGIGRLTWLVVFQRATIRSIFQGADGSRAQRSFTFSPTPHGITEFEERPAPPDVELETRITLEGTQRGYLEPLRRGTEVIAEKVFEHCFNHFVLGRCPRVRILDEGADGVTTDEVNERTRELSISEREPLRVGNHDLELRHVRQRHSSGRRHLGHLLANDRVVSSFLLAEVSDLSNDPIHSESGEAQVHHVYVEGDALNAAADSTRTHFSLPDGAPIFEALGILDLKSLREAVGVNVNAQLSSLLAAEREETLRRVQLHIRTVQPEYARLLEQRPDQLARIKWSDNPRQLDEALYKLKQGWELEIRKQQSEVEQKLVAEKTEIDDISEQLYRVIFETNLAGQDDLVRYVIKRRAVLQLLGQLTSRFRNALEEDIHKIVFPLRKTNGQLAYDDHNLWLVDDTLSFYEFIASDTPLRQQEAVSIASMKRPDVLAFKTGDPFQHVSLVEFKRPDSVNRSPVQQLVDYAHLLRRGGEVDAQGVTMPKVGKSVRIDAYAIVTLTPQMETQLSIGPGEMKEVEGEHRWYGRVENLNLTIEVMDFTTFVRRAQQRNQAFFRPLGLA